MSANQYVEKIAVRLLIVFHHLTIHILTLQDLTFYPLEYCVGVVRSIAFILQANKSCNANTANAS